MFLLNKCLKFELLILLHDINEFCIFTLIVTKLLGLGIY